jgi:hypothetical protein
MSTVVIPALAGSLLAVTWGNPGTDGRWLATAIAVI